MSIDSFVRRMKAAVTPVVETAAAVIRFDDGTPAETANMRRVENEPRDEGLLQQVKNRLIVQGAGLDEHATLVEITEPADRTERASTYLVKLSSGTKAFVRGRVGNVEGDRVRLLVDSVETASETASTNSDVIALLQELNAIESAGWFDQLTAKAKATYLKRFPKSKYAKRVAATAAAADKAARRNSIDEKTAILNKEYRENQKAMSLIMRTHMNQSTDSRLRKINEKRMDALVDRNYEINDEIKALRKSETATASGADDAYTAAMLELAATSKGGKFFPYKKELAELGITLKTDGEDYIVNLKGGKEATAYYTPDLEDAYVSGKSMAEAEKASADTVEELRKQSAANEAAIKKQQAILNPLLKKRAELQLQISKAMPKYSDETASPALRATLTRALSALDDGVRMQIGGTFKKLGLEGDFYHPESKQFVDRVLKAVDALSADEKVRAANYTRLLRLAEDDGVIRAGQLNALKLTRR